ncbi:hypothetical protein SARC_04679 [Sphaeroforma arctica JP610]|uniref:Uncharacterized protein n=1 Tax=Sphaeroforma arctica JP610 TaxID=667725 RepID=A0A0L0G2P4_9EUKA|nr:hypothetical protein SARC_04679 [Sphaeroforma arctica JP610]KNC83061.1 hypothetical protein SARC_04679 [Sphaeroforma arctica JP610]|eukprot:XP_014156963.1 hypothetical protein SARC_04679 [Sphaeroforma arctica JP610]
MVVEERSVDHVGDPKFAGMDVEKHIVDYVEDPNFAAMVVENQTLEKNLVCTNCGDKSSTLYCESCQPGVSWSDEFILDLIIRNTTIVSFQRHVTLGGATCATGVLNSIGKPRVAYPDLSVNTGSRVVFACADENGGHRSYLEQCELARLHVLAFGTTAEVPHVIIRVNTDRIREHYRAIAQIIHNMLTQPLGDASGPFLLYVDYPVDNKHLKNAHAAHGKALILLENIVDMDAVCIDSDLAAMEFADFVKLPEDAVVLSAECLLRQPICRRYVGKRICQRPTEAAGDVMCEDCKKKRRKNTFILTSTGRVRYTADV